MNLLLKNSYASIFLILFTLKDINNYNYIYIVDILVCDYSTLHLNSHVFDIFFLQYQTYDRSIIYNKNE